MSLLGGGDVWGAGVHLTKGQPAQSSTNIGCEMSTQGAGVGGWHLTKGHTSQSSTKLGHEVSTGVWTGGGLGAGGTSDLHQPA